MELDFDHSVLRGLRRYVRLVSQALGLSGQCSYVQADEVICAYIPLDGRLRRFPDRDVALLWEPEQGWSAAVETHSGEDLLVVAYLGQDVLPSPTRVAAWAHSLFDPHREVDHSGHIGACPGLETSGIRERLAAYARPGCAMSPLDDEGLAIG